MRTHFVVSTLALVGLSACAPSPTQLIVDVTRAGNSIEASYSVSGAAEGQSFGSVGSGGPITQWPATIAVRPENNDATRRALIEITTTGGDPFTVRRIVNGYVPGQITRISMRLGRACMGCLATESCEDGMCVATPEINQGVMLDAGPAPIGDAPIGDAPLSDVPMDAPPPPPSFIPIGPPSAVANAVDFDVTERGEAIVLASASVDYTVVSFNLSVSRPAMLTRESEVMDLMRADCSRIARPEPTRASGDAWMALCSGVPYVNQSGTIISIDLMGVTNVVAGDAFAVVRAGSVEARDIDGGPAQLSLGASGRCLPASNWDPAVGGGLLSVAARRGAGGCGDVAAASSLFAVRSNDRMNHLSTAFDGECFASASSPICACPVVAPMFGTDPLFGNDLALGLAGHMATTSGFGVRFPGSPNLRPLASDRGAISVAIGEYAGTDHARFLIAYVDADRDAHILPWGESPVVEQGQCATAPEHFVLPGNFGKIRISDCIDGAMTLGLLNKDEATVTLLRLSCR